MKWGEPVQQQRIRSFRVDTHLRTRAMPSVPKRLDDDRSARESEVDADQLVSAATEHDLCGWFGQTGAVEKTKDLALEPALPTTCDLSPLQNSEHLDWALPTGCPQGIDSSMEEVFARASIAERRVERDGQRLRPNRTGKIDQRPRHREHRESIPPCTIDKRNFLGRVDDVPNASYVAIPGCYEVKWRMEFAAVEAVECTNGWAAHPAWLADIGDKCGECGEVVMG